MKEKYNFKYQSRKHYNFTTPLFIFLFILSIIVMNKYIVFSFLLIPAVIAITILISLWMYYVRDKLNVVKGIFEFSNEEFYYTTCGKTVAISYNEVESITINPYIDTFLIFKKEENSYVIKIKDAGTFTFPIYDNSLKVAIEELNKKIEEYNKNSENQLT